MRTLTELQIRNSKITVVTNAVSMIKINKDAGLIPKNYKGMKITTMKSIDGLIPSQKAMFTIFLNRVFKHYFGVKYKIIKHS